MLTEILEGLYADIPTEKWNGRWHITHALGCERAMAHEARGCFEIQASPSQHQLMDDGLMHEGDIKTRLVIAGVEILELDKWYYPADAPLICRPDGLVVVHNASNLGIPDGTRATFEIKTVDRTDFEYLALGGESHHITKLRPKYGGQAQGYMRYQGTEWTLFLIKDRSLGRYLEQSFAIDHRVGQDIVDKTNRVMALLKANRSCEDIPPSRDFETRLFCPYKEICPDCNYADARITDQYFMELASKWLDAKAVSDDLDAEMSGIKAKMTDVLGAIGNKSVDIVTEVEGVAVRATAMAQNRTLADVEMARKLLTPEMFDQIFRQQESKYITMQKVKDRGA